MKTMHKILAVILSLSILLCGCSKASGTSDTSNSTLLGKWAYIHDTETAVLIINSNGTAEYNNQKYNLEISDDFLTLSASNKSTLTFRYTQDADGIYLYIPTEYLRVDETGSTGLCGTWYCKEKKWSFEFTSDGTFKEDGYFPGYFTDNGDGTFKLIYNDHFEDTLCYYNITDNAITIEYPWRMVKMQ